MLNAISPLDGRYSDKICKYQKYFSEYALIKYRVQVEIEWFLFLSTHVEELPTFSEEQKHSLRSIYQNFKLKDAEEVKKIESQINHDVKAVEYFTKKSLSTLSPFKNYLEFIHFSCTSEDINNLAYALMIKEALWEQFFPTFEEFINTLVHKAKKYKAIPMISRTHGQTASPTTMGKEFINSAYRFKRKLDALKKQPFLGAMNGAVGNFNAHYSAYPKIDWIKLSEQFIHSLALQNNPLTTQIEPHDYIAELSHTLKESNTILIDLDRDIWGYISLGYFKQNVKKNEIGSSTMPHKVNPIDFENSEGNSGLAISLLNHFAEKLPISRWQRDLTDSTVLRNIGLGISYTDLSIQNCLKGLKKIYLNEKKISKDLKNSWEVLAEPIQTIMRKYAIENPYEKLKKLTHGQQVTEKKIRTFIANLNLPEQEIKYLLTLTPNNYTGLAEKLVDYSIRTFWE